MRRIFESRQASTAAKRTTTRVIRTNGTVPSRLRSRNKKAIPFLMLTAMIGTVGAGCGIVQTVPTRPGHTVQCICECQLACKPEEVTLVPRIDNPPEAYCRSVSGGNFIGATIPGFGDDWPGQIPSSTTKSVCVQSDADIPAACDTFCAKESHFSVNAESGRYIVNGAFLGAPSQVCRYANSSSQVSGRTCEIPSTDQYSTFLTASDGATTVTMFTGPSQGAAPVSLTKNGTPMSTRAPEGTIIVSGGRCPNESCPITLEQVRLELTQVPLTVANLDYAALVNTAPISGTKAADGTVSFPADQLRFNATSTPLLPFRPTRIWSSQTAAPATGLTGSFDVGSGFMHLDGTFGDGAGNSAVLSMDSIGYYNPPVAMAGPDQTLSCRPSAVTLNGSQSFDSDGDPMTFAWSENGTLLASTQNASVALAAGTHTLTLTASDVTNQWSQDFVTITVPSNRCRH